MNLSYTERALSESREHITNAVEAYKECDFIECMRLMVETVCLSEYTFRADVRLYLEGMLVAMVQGNHDDLVALRDACHLLLAANQTKPQPKEYKC